MATLERGHKGKTGFRVHLESGADWRAARSLGLNKRQLGWLVNRNEAERILKEIKNAIREDEQR